METQLHAAETLYKLLGRFQNGATSLLVKISNKLVHFFVFFCVPTAIQGILQRREHAL